VTNVGQVLGPLIAGVLIGLAHGYAFAYATDAVLFTAALYSAFRLPPLALEGKSPTLGLRSVLDGLAFIATRPVLIMSFGVDICAMVLAQPRALFPQLAADRYAHTSVLGVISPVGALYASVAVGSVIAGLSSGWIGRVKRQGVALTVAVVGWGTCVALAGLAHQLWLVLLLLALAGAADLVSSVYRQTILQTYAPDEMRGRMQGVFVAVVAGGPRLGDVRAGATAATVGATFAWTGGGIACVVVVLVAAVLVRPFWRYGVSAPRED
jgi:MFS family permease